MADKVDYMLRHTMLGRVGSIWQRQVQGGDRDAIRAIVGVAGEMGTLGAVNQIAAAAATPGPLMVEGTSFRFAAGEYAIIGTSPDDYARHVGSLPDGTPIYVGYRRQDPAYFEDPMPTPLARLARGFLRAIEDVGGKFAGGTDWYLVPVPSGMYPVVISGREKDVYLVRGVDFEAHDGYIAMTESPDLALPDGAVLVPVAVRHVRGVGLLPRSPHRVSHGGKHMARYMYRTQSALSFRRAAAEFAGLYVVQSDAVVKEVVEIGSSVRYTLSDSEVFVIDYPHRRLSQGEEVMDGHVIADRLDVRCCGAPGDTGGAGMRRLVDDWVGIFSLDGILPVKGLTWDGRSRVLADSVSSDPDSGVPHVRLHFGGTSGARQALWAWQLAQERHTGETLYESLNLTSLPTEIDVWDLLSTFYGTKLLVVLASPHADDIDARLRLFVEKHRPASCCVLSSLQTTLPAGVMLDAGGAPMLDEDGKYAVA
jgi:hypothetical protein